jgi:hypothetical protein
MGNRQGTNKVFDINTVAVKKPCTVTLLPMPDRVIKVVNDWGHAEEDIKLSLTFLNHKKQLYDWDNDDLQDEEGLIEDPEGHRELSAKFPSIDLESKQPHHHHIIEVLKASNDEHINAAIRNASLDDLPCNTTGVLTAVDSIEINNWIKQQQIYKDPDNDLPALPTMAIPLEAMPAIIHNDAQIPTPAVTTITENKDLGSIIIGGVCCSARAPASRRLTKVSFDNKPHPDGKYRDGTIHIMVDTGHHANHPSPIDPDPLMHALGTAMMHYVNPDARALVFAQVYSFKAGLKNFGEVGSKAAVTKLTQLHSFHVYNPVRADFLTPAKCKTALEMLMNTGKKGDRLVHARAVADGSKEWHQPGYKKEDVASPTIATDSIMITATIHVHEC